MDILDLIDTLLSILVGVVTLIIGIFTIITFWKKERRDKLFTNTQK